MIDAKGKSVTQEQWIAGLDTRPSYVKMSLGRYEMQSCPHSIGGIPISIDSTVDAGEVHFVDAYGEVLEKIMNIGG